MQGFTAFAQTISGNEAVAETENVSVTENVLDEEAAIAEVEETLNSADASVTPSNPIHNCTMLDDGSDTTTWSYIYFGSYPQSEVTDAATIAAIDSAITAGNGTTADAGTGCMGRGI